MEISGFQFYLSSFHLSSVDWRSLMPHPRGDYLRLTLCACLAIPCLLTLIFRSIRIFPRRLEVYGV